MTLYGIFYLLLLRPKKKKTLKKVKNDLIKTHFVVSVINLYMDFTIYISLERNFNYNPMSLRYINKIKCNI